MKAKHEVLVQEMNFQNEEAMKEENQELPSRMEGFGFSVPNLTRTDVISKLIRDAYDKRHAPNTESASTKW